MKKEFSCKMTKEQLIASVEANSFQKVLTGNLSVFNKTAKIGDSSKVVIDLTAIKGFKTFKASQSTDNAIKALPMYSDSLNEHYTMGVFCVPSDSELESKFKINFNSPDEKIHFINEVLKGNTQQTVLLECINFIPKGESIGKRCMTATFVKA